MARIDNGVYRRSFEAREQDLQFRCKKLGLRLFKDRASSNSYYVVDMNKGGVYDAKPGQLKTLNWVEDLVLGKEYPDRATRIRFFDAVREKLRELDMLKSDNARQNGWQYIYCPWTKNHTDEIDGGASICEPSETTGYNGAFKCHHNSCKERGWRDLTQWISEDMAKELDAINDAAKEIETYA